MTIEATPRIPAYAIWTGRAISALVILFLAMDGIMKLIDPAVVQQTMGELGYSPGLDRSLGVLTLAIAILYAIPKTAPLGALLMTAFLGGAVASRVRIDSPLFTHILFGVYVGVLAWSGLWLRDPRLRRLLPFDRG